MANKYVHKPTEDKGSVPYGLWVEKHVTPAKYEGKDVVRVVDHKGETKSMPVSAAAILCKNPTQMRETFSYEYKIHPDYVPLLDSYRARGGVLIDDRIGKVPASDIVIPLGQVTSDSNTTFLMQQAAREYLSQGANNLNISDENVANMMLTILKTLVFTLSQATRLDAQLKWFEMTCHFARTVDVYQKQSTIVSKVIGALRTAEITDDSLQKSLAYMFETGSGQTSTTDPEDIWRILEVALKRATKFKKGTILEAPEGFLACLVIVPLIRRLLKGVDSLEQAQKTFNKFLVTFGETSAKLLLGGSSAEDIDTIVLGDMLKFAGVTSTSDQVRKFVNFCRSLKNLSTSAPLQDWGILPRVTLAFPCKGDNIKSKAGKCSPVVVKPLADGEIMVPVVSVVEAKYGDGKEEIKERKEGELAEEVKEPGELEIKAVKETTATSCSVVSSKPTEWAGVALELDGIYTISNCEAVGIAEIGSGSILGKELQAVLRVTSGPANNLNVLPSNRQGVSSAGKFCRIVPSGGGKTKEVYEDCRALSLLRPAQLHLLPTTIQVWQDGKELVQVERTVETDHMILGFKNVKFRLSYQAFPKPAPSILKDEKESKDRESKDVAMDDGAAELLAKSGMTPMALIAELSKLAVARTKDKVEVKADSNGENKGESKCEVKGDVKEERKARKEKEKARKEIAKVKGNK